MTVSRQESNPTREPRIVMNIDLRATANSIRQAFSRSGSSVEEKVRVVQAGYRLKHEHLWKNIVSGPAKAYLAVEDDSDSEDEVEQISESVKARRTLADAIQNGVGGGASRARGIARSRRNFKKYSAGLLQKSIELKNVTDRETIDVKKKIRTLKLKKNQLEKKKAETKDEKQRANLQAKIVSVEKDIKRSKKKYAGAVIRVRDVYEHGGRLEDQFGCLPAMHTSGFGEEAGAVSDGETSASDNEGDMESSNPIESLQKRDERIIDRNITKRRAKVHSAISAIRKRMDKLQEQGGDNVTSTKKWKGYEEKIKNQEHRLEMLDEERAKRKAATKLLYSEGPNKYHLQLKLDEEDRRHWQRIYVLDRREEAVRENTEDNLDLLNKLDAKVTKENQKHERARDLIQRAFESEIQHPLSCLPMHVIAENEKSLQNVEPVVSAMRGTSTSVRRFAKQQTDILAAECFQEPLLAKFSKGFAKNATDKDSDSREWAERLHEILDEFEENVADMDSPDTRPPVTIPDAFIKLFDDLAKMLIDMEKHDMEDLEDVKAHVLNDPKRGDPSRSLPVHRLVKAYSSNRVLNHFPGTRSKGEDVLVTSALQLLLDNGGEPLSFTVDNRTPLILACNYLNDPSAAVVAACLLEQNPDMSTLTSLDNFGYNALSYAVLEGKQETTKLLLAYGAPLDQRIGPELPDVYTNPFLELTGKIVHIGFSATMTENERAEKQEQLTQEKLAMIRLLFDFYDRPHGPFQPVKKVVGSDLLGANFVDSAGRNGLMRLIFAGDVEGIEEFVKLVLMRGDKHLEDIVLRQRCFRGMNAIIYAVRAGKLGGKNHDGSDVCLFDFLLDKCRTEIKGWTESKILEHKDVYGCGVLFHSCCSANMNDSLFTKVWESHRTHWANDQAEKARVAVLVGRTGNLSDIDLLRLHPLEMVWRKPVMLPPPVRSGLTSDDTNDDHRQRNRMLKEGGREYMPLAVALAENSNNKLAEELLNTLVSSKKTLSSRVQEITINMRPPGVKIPENAYLSVTALLGSGQKAILDHAFTQGLADSMWNEEIHKFVVWEMILYAVYLLLFTSCVLFRNNASTGFGNFAFEESLFWLLSIPVTLMLSYLVIVEFLELRTLGIRIYFSSSWNYFDWFTYLTGLATIALMWLNAPGWRHLSSMCMLASWMRSLIYMTKFRRTAVFVLIIFSMLKSTFSFLAVLMVFFFAFGTSLFVMLIGNDGYNSMLETLMTMLRGFVGDFDYGIIHDHGGVFGSVLFMAFALLVATLLLNLLISLLASGYEEATRNAETLQIDLRCKAIVRELNLRGRDGTKKLFAKMFNHNWDLPLTVAVQHDGSDDTEDLCPEDIFLRQISRDLSFLTNYEQSIYHEVTERRFKSKFSAEVLDRTVSEQYRELERLKDDVDKIFDVSRSLDKGIKS